MARSLQKSLCSGGHGIYKFGRPFLGHHNCTLSCFYPCLKISCLLTLQMLHIEFGQVVLEKKMLTEDSLQTQPIAIGHLSDSSDLKIIRI